MLQDNVGFDSSDYTPEKAAETKIAFMALAVLMKQFPGYDWKVDVSFTTGFCDVYTDFSGQFGFRINLNDASSSSEFERNVALFGGEFLERFNLSREKADQDAIDSLVFDLKGVAVGDRS